MSTKTCMCTAALVTISKIQKKPRYPSVGEPINKFWFIHTLEYYSGLKRNELSSHNKTWRKLNCISLSERYQSEKATGCTIPILRHSRKGKTMETVERTGVAGKDEQAKNRTQGHENTLSDYIMADTAQSLSCVWLAGLHGLQPTRLHCPWNFPGKNTGMGCHFLLQIIFLTQGSNPCLLHLLHWQADSLPLVPPRKPRIMTNTCSYTFVQTLRLRNIKSEL